MAFQTHFIEAQSNLRERQYTLYQGVYGSNDLVGIEESFMNLAQDTLEGRAAVTKLTGSNMNLETQVTEYSNHLATKDSAMASTTKLSAIFRG